MLLAILSVVGVVVIQLLWLREASRYRQEQVELNHEQALQLATRSMVVRSICARSTLPSCRPITGTPSIRSFTF